MTDSNEGNAGERKPVILITGATGLLGAQIARMASSGNSASRVLVATRRAAPPKIGPRPAPDVVPMDLACDVVEVPRGVDALIHAAGEKRDESRMTAVNAVGTLRLAEAAARAGVRRFVYVSSVGVYGAASHSGLLSESHAHRPRNAYESSKHSGEVHLRDVGARTGMDFVILQPTNVIGTVRGRHYPLLGLMRMIRDGYFTWFGHFDACANYVAVEDVASAVLASVSHAPSGRAYIINTPAPLSAVVAWIAEELGARFPQRHLPLWAGRVAALLGSAIGGLSGRTMPIDRERLQALTSTTQYDPSYFMKLARHEYPLGIQAAIRALVRSYRGDGLL